MLGEGPGELDVLFIEGFEQREQIQLERLLDERFELGTLEHAQDDEHAAGPAGAGFGDLVGVDEKVLAHGWHAQRRECFSGGRRR